MEFVEGAKVFSADGKRVGTVDRVVLDPDTKEVTDLVIRKGFLFTEDKVIPISLVGPATEDKVTLRRQEDGLEALPNFEETHYVEADLGYVPDLRSAGRPRPLLWYPPLGPWWTTGAYVGYGMPQYVAKTEKNIPEGTVALEEGAKVISRDGKHVGDIERIFTEPQEDRATHLLISEGLILKERKLVPTTWMSTVLEDEVHLSVNSDLVESLPEYEPRG